MLAGISYTTFPDFQIGPLTIRSFGTLVGIGVLIGAWVAAKRLERWGIERDETYRMATRMVVGGVIGSRVTWVATHLDRIDNPIDLIAVWEGGIQFSGGFVAALLIGYPTFRSWGEKLRWRSLDGYAYGLVIGLAIGRIGCYSVGEHFGRSTDFFLGTTYRGGGTQEPIDIGGGMLVDESQAIGATFHNTSLYEFLHLMVLFALLTVFVVRRPGGTKAGTITGIFVLWYGIMRFATDLLRVNDNTVLGMTGAQWMGVVMVPAGLYILLKLRHRVEALPEDDDKEPALVGATDTESDTDSASSTDQDSGTDDDLEGPAQEPSTEPDDDPTS